MFNFRQHVSKSFYMSPDTRYTPDTCCRQHVSGNMSPVCTGLYPWDTSQAVSWRCAQAAWRWRSDLRSADRTSLRPGLSLPSSTMAWCKKCCSCCPSTAQCCIFVPTLGKYLHLVRRLHAYLHLTKFNMAAVRRLGFVGEVMRPPTNARSWWLSTEKVSSWSALYYSRSESLVTSPPCCASAGSVALFICSNLADLQWLSDIAQLDSITC